MADGLPVFDASSLSPPESGFEQVLSADDALVRGTTDLYSAGVRRAVGEPWGKGAASTLPVEFGGQFYNDQVQTDREPLDFPADSDFIRSLEKEVSDLAKKLIADHKGFGSMSDEQVIRYFFGADSVCRIGRADSQTFIIGVWRTWHGEPKKLVFWSGWPESEDWDTFEMENKDGRWLSPELTISMANEVSRLVVGGAHGAPGNCDEDPKWWRSF